MKWDDAPPPYTHIGKKARELFHTGYYFGVLALDIKTKSNNNVEISTSWIENIEDNRLQGMVEAKYQLANCLSLTEKLSKDCFLNTELCYKSKSLQGLRLNFGGAFSPMTGLRTGLVKAEYSNRYCFVNLDLEVARNFAFVTSSLVLGSRGLLGGLQWKYDLHNERQAEVNFALGYESQDMHLHTFVANGKDFGGSIYHKVSPVFEVGIDMKWWAKGPEPLFGVAGRFRADRDVVIRWKINNSNELGLSYEQKLSEGVALTVSSCFDLKNLTAWERKFGLGLSMQL